MSNILEQMQKDNITARKERDTVRANLLGTVISDAKMVGKNDGNREPTSDEVMQVVKKFLKGIQESLEAMTKSGRDTTDALREQSILEGYLPKQLTDAELKKAIADIVAGLGEKSPKLMGAVMAQLKEKYPNMYDGKAASAFTKEALG